MARENGEIEKPSMSFQQRVAHLYDAASQPATDPFGRANPNRGQLAQLAQRLRTLREGDDPEESISVGDANRRAIETDRKARRITAKKLRSRGNGNGSHQQKQIPGAFGRNR